MIFCVGDGKFEKSGFGYQKNNMAFNKQVTHERYEEILHFVSSLGIKKKNSFNETMKGITAEQWQKILTLDEADQSIIEKITGFKLPLNDDVEIVVDGVSKFISRKSAKTLNLI